MPAVTAEAGMDFAARFSELDAWLHQHQALWRAKPFTSPGLPCESALPKPANWLRDRILKQAERGHNHLQLLDAPGPFASLGRQAIALARFRDWSEGAPAAVPER